MANTCVFFPIDANLQQFSTKSTRACFRTAHCHIFFFQSKDLNIFLILILVIATWEAEFLQNELIGCLMCHQPLRKFDVSTVSTCEIRSFNGRSILLINLVFAYQTIQTFFTAFCVQLTTVVIIWHFPSDEYLNDCRRQNKRPDGFLFVRQSMLKGKVFLTLRDRTSNIFSYSMLQSSNVKENGTKERLERE